MPYKLGLLLLSGVATSLAAEHVACSETAVFYENQHYTVRKIEISSPFGFLSVVRDRLNQLKDGLALTETGPFSTEDFKASFKQVDKAVNGDGVFGNPPAKFVWVADYLENCQEKDHTVDVRYRVYSTDPVLAAPKTPEDRQATIEHPATSTAQKNTVSSYAFQPLMGYDRTRHGYGGGELKAPMPGVFNTFELSGWGSSSSRAVDARFDGSKAVKNRWLERVEYNLGYQFSDLPAADLQLIQGFLAFRATAYSKPIETRLGELGLRYGASIEQGNQQDGHPIHPMPVNTLGSSRYGALQFYTGATLSTQHSSTIVSYGLQGGGAGLGSVSFAKQVGDITYRRRFPGASHRPLDLEARASAGGILTSSPMLLNERFFGGNSVSPFIPGDSWLIPSGPVVRSIPTNRLAGNGFGGDSFYSSNLTIGKVLFRSPLIPDVINNQQGFGAGINAAEQTAETFFADDYETSSADFLKIVADNADNLTKILKAVRQLVTEIRSSGTAPSELGTLLGEIDNSARRSMSLISHATAGGPHGQTHALEIMALLNSTSQARKLIEDLSWAAPLAPTAFATRLTGARSALEAGLMHLQADRDTVHNGRVGTAARARAKRDMARPRETIQTLRNEVNIFSIGLAGIFDVGRLFPDQHGTRFAYGGGIRFGVVNVNLTLGLAFNPQPRQELGQGPRALFLQATFTDLFR